MKKHNPSETPISASDYVISMMFDASTPLILELQLFWFEDDITKFLKEETFFESSNGIRIAWNTDFTYTPFEMEAPYQGYLLGFGSNMHKECFNKISIKLKSEDEKFTLKHNLEAAIHELVQAALQRLSTSSLRVQWHLDK